MTLPAWDKITTSEEWKNLSDEDKRTVYQGYLSDLGDTDAWKTLRPQERLTVVDAIMKDAGFAAPVEDAAAVDKTGFVKNITDFYGGVKDRLVTGATNIFNKVKTGLKPVAPSLPGEMSVEEIRDMTEAGLDVNNMPAQNKESILVPIMDTLKSIPPVVTAVAGPMAAMPGAGVEAAAQLLPRISADPDKLIDLGSLEDAQAVLDKRLGAFSEFISTPEQIQAIEYIGLASKPFEMAGEGWRLIGAGINNALKDPNVDPNIDPIPILEPFLASLGEISAVMGLPEILKKLKAMPPEQRALVTKEIADTVSSEGLTEAELLRKLGPNSDLWKAKIRQQQEAARAYAGEAESLKPKAERTESPVTTKPSVDEGSIIDITEKIIQKEKEVNRTLTPAEVNEIVASTSQATPVNGPVSAVPPAPVEAVESIAQSGKQTEQTNQADLIEKPRPAIPEFKDSEEAIAFGMKASPEELARIKELQVEFDATARQLVGSGNTKDGQVVGQLASYMREAIEANANPERFTESLKKGEERKAETAGLSVNEAMAKELEKAKERVQGFKGLRVQGEEKIGQSAESIEQGVGKPIPLKKPETVEAVPTITTDHPVYGKQVLDIIEEYGGQYITKTDTGKIATVSKDGRIVFFPGLDDSVGQVWREENNTIDEARRSIDWVNDARKERETAKKIAEEKKAIPPAPAENATEYKFGTAAESKQRLNKELDVWMADRTQAQWDNLGGIYRDRLKRAKSELNKLAKGRDAVTVKDKIALSKARNFDEMREIINGIKDKVETQSAEGIEQGVEEKKPIPMKNEAQGLKLQAQEKEPWQMTEQEFEEATYNGEDLIGWNNSQEKIEADKLLKQSDNIVKIDNSKEAKEKADNLVASAQAIADEFYVGKDHRSQVQKAISEGKPVPEEVLKDYPDLVPIKNVRVEKKPIPMKEAEGSKVEAEREEEAVSFDIIDITIRYSELAGAEGKSMSFEIAQKNAQNLYNVIENRVYGDIVHPDNKLSRKIFEEVTGEKLPAGVKATQDYFTQSKEQKKAVPKKTQGVAQSAEGIEQGGEEPTAVQTDRTELIEKKPIPMKEAESSKVEVEDKNKIVVPPFTKYSLIGTAYNAASLRPAVGKKFSQEEIDILKTWLQEQGYSVGSANANKIDVNNPTGEKLNLIDGFQYNRDQKIRESRKQQDKEYEERQSVKQQEFEALPSSAWIKDIFGENVANASLRLALARYLDGLDKKYTGIGHVTFLPGLEKLGLNSEKHEMADIKSKYLEWKDTTTEKKPIPMKEAEIENRNESKEMQETISKNDLNLFQFNKGNIWNNDQVEQYRNDIRLGKKIEPIEVVLDDKGDIFVVDGHHRAKAAQLEKFEIPYIEADESVSAGIDLLEWEKEPSVKIKNKQVEVEKKPIPMKEAESSKVEAEGEEKKPVPGIEVRSQKSEVSEKPVPIKEAETTIPQDTAVEGKGEEITSEIAKDILQNYNLPKGWYIHGRQGGNELKGDSWPIMMTRDVPTANGYAGGKGSVWIIKPNKETRIADFSSDNTSDMDSFISALKEIYNESIESGYVDNALVKVAEGLADSENISIEELSFDQFEEEIRKSFTPSKIVDTAEAFDSPDYINLLEYYPGGYPDFVKTPDGAVVIPGATENVDKVNITELSNKKESQPVPEEVLKEYPDLQSKPAEEKPVGEKVKIEDVVIEDKGREKVVKTDLTKKEADKLSLKEQKQYLIAEIDKAIEQAPEKQDIEILGKERAEEIKQQRKEIENKISDFSNARFNVKEGVWEERELTTNEQSELKNLKAKLASLSYTNIVREGIDRNIEKFVIIEIPGDGKYRILNDKKALNEFKKRAAQMALEYKPEEAKFLPEKSMPYKKEDIGEIVTINDMPGWFTDYNLIIKSKIPKNAPLSANPSIDKKDAERYLGRVKNAKPAKFLYYAIDNPDIGQAISERPIRDSIIENRKISTKAENRSSVIFEVGNKKIAYNQDKFNAIKNRYPDAEYKIEDKPAVEREGSMLFAIQDGKPVAMLAPLQMAEESYKLFDKLISEKETQVLQSTQLEEKPKDIKKPVPTKKAESSKVEAEREKSSAEAPKSKPIPGKKSSSGSASYGGDPDVGGYATNIKYVLELPELVRLARDLMDGKYPQIKKNLGKYAGMFYHSGKIAIKADVFKDEKQVAAVLAHEIGHLVDWLPDKDMKKGNILGRIASLHNYLKKTLPQYPGAPDELTTQDRSRLRYQAQKMAKAQSENEWIDEIIKKELPIEPQDVLNIWNAVDVARAINPDLYEYVARLSTAQKKAVVKDALQGVVRDELKQFAKVIEEKTGKQVKQELSEEEFKKLVSQKYKDLINEEIKKRRLFDYENIMEELKELTRIWKPFDPVLDPKYTKYRYSAKELYADAFSALLNAPGFLKAAAPNFYEALFNYMENKPEVKRHYEDLQAKIASGEIESERIEEVYRMFKKGDEAYALSLDKESRFYDAVMRDFVDLAHMVLKKVRKVGERNIPAAENPRYKIEEMNYSGSEIEWLLTRVKTEIMKPLDKSSLTWDDFGVELYLRRVKGDRSGIANPQGWTARLAEKKLEELKRLRTAKQNTGMEEAVKAFQDLREYVIDKAEKTGRWDNEIIKMMRNDMDYATFDVIKYIEKRYGAGPSAKIYPQVGTFNEISNPATATIMKDISILKAVNRGVAAESVTKFFKMHFPNEIKPAETKWNGKFQEIQPPDRGSGQGLIVYLKNGKPEGYYVDEWVADIFEKNPIEGHVISKVLGWLAQPFRTVFTEINPGFALFNVIRDYKRSVKNLPGASLSNFAKFYNKAIKPSFKSVYGIPDSVVDETLKGNMLISIADFRGQVSEDKQIDRLLKMYHLEKAKWDKGIIKPFGYFFHYLSNINRSIERIPKIAGYMYLKEKYPDLPDEVVGHMVRNIGSPAFLNRGRWYPIYSNFFLFSNAMKEGYRGDYEAMAKKPGEWWWKTAKYVFLPKLLMMAGSVGLLGAAVKVIMDGISDYDKANFITVPLGLTPSGKSVILRIPTDETGRLLGGILWKATGMQKKDTITDLLDYMAGQVPTVSPAIENLAAVVQYASGKNPYDSFYGSYAIPEQIFEAGGARSHKAFLKWMLNNSGAGIVYRFKNDDVDSVKNELEEILGYPIASNIIGRFIKVTDRGLKETIEADKQMLKKLQAQENLAVKDALAKSFRDEELTDEEIQLILNKVAKSPEMIDRNMMTMWSRKYGQMYMEEFITAQTKEQKAAVLNRMLERDNLLEKAGIELKPIPMKENK